MVGSDLALGLGVAVVLAGCGAPGPTLLDDPLGELPALLSGVGLYPDLDDLSVTAADVHGYQPLHALWSGGSDKDRFVAVPAPIDTSDRTAWVFPPGALLFKTFRFGASAVETRVLRRADDRWEYAAYRWRDDRAEADLLALDEPVPVAVTLDGDDFDHLIPSRLDCRSCHESAASPVLGFGELGLGADQLAALATLGVLDGDLPDDPDAIVADDDLEREVLGYLEGNCTHCHNGGDGPSSSFDLRHGVAREAVICVPTNDSQTAAGFRVVPGDPAASILFLALSGETDDPEVKAMPPLGVDRPDRDAIELLRAWIEALPGTCP